MKLIQEVPIVPKSAAAFADILGPDRVAAVETLAAQLRDRLAGRVVWNVNSTAAGGGVAEMLHTVLAYARGLGVDTRWLVIAGDPEFFRVTKRLHNALHGDEGDGSPLGPVERETYERTAAANAAELLQWVRPGDFLILHDPQTAGLIEPLAGHGAPVIWRCHIGSDSPGPQEELGWAFLEPYLRQARAFVFSRFSYVPPTCEHGRSVVIAPTIDPFSPKNCLLDDQTIRAVLVGTGLIGGDPGAGVPTYIAEDGTPRRVDNRADVLREAGPPDPHCPLVVQVSRWDRLKDPVGVLRGFAGIAGAGPRCRRAELVLAGPNVTAVADDPEGAEVFEEVATAWRELPLEIRRRVHLANLPMDDRQENAIIVNALQRHASVVVQKSLREGFGLTVTEAMWKGRAVVASAVGGIQDQIQHGVSGLLVRDPADLTAFGAMLRQAIEDPVLAASLGEHARERVAEQFLGLHTLTRFAGLIARLDRAE